MNRIVYGLLAFLLGALAWTGVASAAEQPLYMKIDANIIEISTFSNGTSLEVTGNLPEDADVVIQVSGPKKDVHLKEKGKVAGILWMNKNDVSLNNTPAVYMVYTPEGPTEKFINPGTGIGYQALVRDIDIEPESADKTFIFGEFVKLMEKSGVYAVHKAAVTYNYTRKGIKDFSARLIVPSSMSVGKYRVEAIAIQHGVPISRVSEDLTLELAGLPKIISSLAFGSPLLFGIMSVFIAIATGLVIGLLFKGSGGSH